MQPAGFKSSIPAIEQPPLYTLDCTSTGIGWIDVAGQYYPNMVTNVADSEETTVTTGKNLVPELFFKSKLFLSVCNPFQWHVQQ